MAQAAALTGFGTGARCGNARVSRRAMTGRCVQSDRYYSADPFRRWNDSMPGTRVQTSLLKSPPDYFWSYCCCSRSTIASKSHSSSVLSVIMKFA